MNVKRGHLYCMEKSSMDILLDTPLCYLKDRVWVNDDNFFIFLLNHPFK